uniref:Uncharacterized protein n=1 Tax=Anguilla anguilla TaxID=7936 RepID=A0A0E9XHF6_ANGAN
MKVLGDSRPGPFCVECACSPPVCEGFLPQSKDMQMGYF